MSVPAAVCTDKFVSYLHLTDIATVIHYDIPMSKTEFSNRLGCMRQHFRDFSKPDSEQVG